MLATVMPLAAAANAGLLALALAWRSWPRRSRTGLYAAAFLLGAAAAIALIALDHAGAPWDPRLVAFLEGALTLAAGPLLLLFVSSLLGRKLVAWPLFAPLALFVIAAAVFPGWVARAFSVERLVVVQMLFTLAAGAATAAHNPVGRRAAGARTLAAASVAAMAVLHLAQLARLIWPRVEALHEIVPLVGAVAFLAATGAVYFGGRVSALAPLIDAPPAADDKAREVVARLEAALAAGLLRNADLTLPRAAAAVDAAPEEIARALLAAEGLSFSEYVQGLRVSAAKRLLDDAAEARTSMEAIGLLVGFGSRSAFYRAFGEQVGMSPAAYRAQKSVPTQEIGH